MENIEHSSYDVFFCCCCFFVLFLFFVFFGGERGDLDEIANINVAGKNINVHYLVVCHVLYELKTHTCLKLHTHTIHYTILEGGVVSVFTHTYAHTNLCKEIKMAISSHQTDCTWVLCLIWSSSSCKKS